MKIHFTVRTGFKILCVSMKVFGIWPILSSRKSHCIFYYSLWWFYLINHLILLLPTFHTFLTSNTGNISLASMTWLEITGMIECMTILLNFKIQEKRLKNLLCITKKQLSNEEASVSLENANVYVAAVSTIALLYIIVMYIYGNRPDRSTILTTTQYIFPIESTTLQVVIFCNQFIVMSHTAVVMVTDGIFLLFSYVCAIRLKLLEKKLQRTKDYKELKEHICEHQNILFLIEETNLLVGLMVVKSIICFMCYSIGVGLQMIDPSVTNLEAMNNFPALALIYLRLFICAESAETIASVTTDIQRTIYSTSWYAESPKCIVLKIMIIRRCQKVPRIYVNGLMPALNRHYIGRIFYLSYSGFMAVRTILSQ